MRIDGRHQRGASMSEDARGSRHSEPECSAPGKASTRTQSSRCKALLQNACLQCRDAKRRCDHLSPCTRCKRMGLPCTVSVRPPGRPRKRASGEESCSMSGDADVSLTPSSTSGDLDVVVNAHDVMATDGSVEAVAETSAHVCVGAGGGGGARRGAEVGVGRGVRRAGRSGKRSWGADGGGAGGEMAGEDDEGTGGGGGDGASHAPAAAMVPTQVAVKPRPSKRARGMASGNPLHTDRNAHVNARAGFAAHTRAHTHTHVRTPVHGGVEGGDGDVVSYTTACLVNSVLRLGSAGILDADKARGFLRRLSACFNHGMGTKVYTTLRDVLLHILGPQLAHDNDTHTHTHTPPSVAVDAVTDAGAGEAACRMQWTIDTDHRNVRITADTRMCATFLDAHDTLAHLTQTGLLPMYTWARVLTTGDVAVVCDAMCAVELGVGGDQGCDGLVVECHTLSGHTISCVASLSHHSAGPHTSTTTLTLLPYPTAAPLDPPIIADIIADMIADNTRTSHTTSSSSSSSRSINHNLTIPTAGGPVAAAAASYLTQRVGGELRRERRGGSVLVSFSAPVPPRTHANAHQQQQHTHAYTRTRRDTCTPLMVSVGGGVAMDGPSASSTTDSPVSGLRVHSSARVRTVRVGSPHRDFPHYSHHQQQQQQQQQQQMVAMQSYAAPLSFVHTHTHPNSHTHQQQQDGEVMVTPRTPSGDVGGCHGLYDGVRVPHTHTHTHAHTEAHGGCGEEGADVPLMEESLLQLIALELSIGENVGMVCDQQRGCGVNVNGSSTSSIGMGSTSTSSIDSNTASLAASACAALPPDARTSSSSTHTHHTLPQVLQPPPTLSLSCSSTSSTTIASTCDSSAADHSWPSSPLTHSDTGSLDFDLWDTSDEWADTRTHDDDAQPSADTPACAWDTCDPMDPLDTMPMAMPTLSAQSSESDVSLETVGGVFDVAGLGGDGGVCVGVSSGGGAWGAANTTTTTLTNKHTAQMPPPSSATAAGTLSYPSPSPSPSSWTMAMTPTTTTTTQHHQQQPASVQLPISMMMTPPPSLHTGLSLSSMGNDSFSGAMLLDDWAFHSLSSVLDDE